MFWIHPRSTRGAHEAAASRFRREHEAFLTRAIQLDLAYPRIPTRRVDAGGYDRLRARGGMPHAERWWRRALDGMDRPRARDRARVAEARAADASMNH